ncbi:mechanosensitive ion channel family protein, partial [Aquimarina celericrescens]|nr:mechanosensitive ion channel family protein [Aquimarina celericrescens]
MLVLYEFIPVVLVDFPSSEIYFEKLFEVIIIFVIIWILKSILMTFRDYLRTFNSFKDKPLESYIQVFMIIVWIVGII